MTLLLALISHIGWGAGDVFVVMAARRLGTFPLAAWSMIVGFVLLTFLAPFFASDFAKLSPISLLLLLILGAFLVIGHIAFNEGLRVGNPTVVGVISASFVAVSVILSLLFLGETLTPLKGLFITIIIAGVIVCLCHDRLSFSWGRGELMAFISMIGWGVYYAFVKVAIEQVGWFVPGYLAMALFPIVLWVTKVRGIPLGFPFKRGVFLIFLLSLLPAMIAEYCYNIALQSGDVSFVLPIGGSYPALFVLLSSVVFREKIFPLQWAGIGATLAGIIGLSIVGS